MDVNGFQLLPSQVESMQCIFERHPDFASKLRPKNQHLKSTYINFLLGLMETLSQSPEEDLDEVSIALSYLENGGFKLDWLEKKLVEVKSKKRKVETGKAQHQKLERVLQKLNHQVLELKALLEKENADLSHNNVPLSFNAIV